MRAIILFLIMVMGTGLANDLCSGCISKRGDILFPNSIITSGDSDGILGE